MESKKKILLVDDDELLIKTYRTLFVQAGFDVIEAHDGEEGFIRATTEHPDLIMLDIAMPKKDGLTVMRELRNHEKGKDVPIIILTAKDIDESRLQEIAQWNPAYYLVKGSTSLSEILAKAQSVFGN